MNLIKGFIALIALALVAFVGLGLALDGTWQVTREVELSAPAEVVFPYVNELEGWDRWVPWDHVDDTWSGPSAGAGASRRWDDPQWGQGEWTLTESDPPRRVAYEVRVEGGSLVTRGEITVERVGSGGSRLAWTENGDFGWNPFLSYMALGMDRMQGREMEKNLAQLKTLVEGERR
jgi:uncharacterized protein YndB with AHSA1/START domain